MSITQECYFIITLKGAQGRGGQSSFIASRGEGVFILKGGGHAVFRGTLRVQMSHESIKRGLWKIEFQLTAKERGTKNVTEVTVNRVNIIET